MPISLNADILSIFTSNYCNWLITFLLINGFILHICLVNTYSGLPISYIITPANIADVDVTEKLIQKMMDDYKNRLTPKYYMMDAGCCAKL